LIASDHRSECIIIDVKYDSGEDCKDVEDDGVELSKHNDGKSDCGEAG